MIYFLGSNLETPDVEYEYDGGAASKDIAEILNADIPEDVNVVLECGGALEWMDERVPDAEVTRFSVEDGELVQVESLGYDTMTQTGDLTDFLQFAAENYPAENYTLILWDHGGGIPVSFGSDELGDEDDGFCDYEIRDELEASGLYFDAIIFDACNMCTLEMGCGLENYADYMVGAESYVNNSGIYYTNWLEMTDGSAMDFCEKIVQDYMDEIAEEGQIGSMSVIRLSYMEDVYDAYVAYVETLLEDLDSGYYAAYTTSRSNCGYFEDNDAVDLIAMATAYETSASADLINAVVNAVSYTESDFSFGHGLMAYSPYEWYEYYDDGRESFIAFDYDQTILDFYDRYISLLLTYYGEDYVYTYGNDWYQTDYVTAYLSENGGVSSSISAVGDDTAVTANEGAVVIDAILTDYYYAVELTEDDLSIIDNVEYTIYLDEGDGTLLYLGSDYTGSLDSYNRLALVDPTAWVMINDNIVCYYCTGYYNDEYSGEWMQTGMVPIFVNDYYAYLYIYFDEEHPQGAVMGYSYFDPETMEISDNVYTLEDTDILDLCYQYVDEDYNYVFGWYDEYFYASDLEISYQSIDLNDYTTYGYYTIYDVYGNIYETDVLPLGSSFALE